MPHENSLYPAEWTRIAEKDMRRVDRRPAAAFA